MAAAVYNARHGALMFSDATGAPITVAFLPTEGDFSVSGLEQGGLATDIVRNRGDVYERVTTDEKLYSGSITLAVDGDLTDATVKRVVDAVMKTGAFASGTTDERGGQTWTGSLAWTMTRNSVVNTVTLPECRLSVDLSEGFPATTMTINYECPGSGVTITSA